jgi:hypothetical protein
MVIIIMMMMMMMMIIIIITVIPVITGATGTISKSCRQCLSNIQGKHNISYRNQPYCSVHTYYIQYYSTSTKCST